DTRRHSHNVGVRLAKPLAASVHPEQPPDRHPDGGHPFCRDVFHHHAERVRVELLKNRPVVREQYLLLSHRETVETVAAIAQSRYPAEEDRRALTAAPAQLGKLDPPERGDKVRGKTPQAMPRCLDDHQTAI